MKSISALDWTALVLSIIGGVNWGMVGLFKFDLVASMFGEFSLLSRVIYLAVGLSAVYLIFASAGFARRAGMMSRIVVNN